MNRPNAPLQLFLLGHPNIIHNDQPLGNTLLLKAQALLAYLALTQRPQPRSHLAGLLWSDMPEETARANLRTALARLRKPLDSYLHTTRHTVALDNAYWCDVIAFLELVRQEARETLHTALQLYRGDLLDGWDVSGAMLFEEWLFVERERLRLLALDGWERLAEVQQSAGDGEAAIEATRQLLTLDPLRESGHRRLIRLLALRGDRAAALEQYALCRQLLHDELGIVPSASTRAG